jgi:hypothetical protein
VYATQSNWSFLSRAASPAPAVEPVVKFKIETAARPDWNSAAPSFLIFADCGKKVKRFFGVFSLTPQVFPAV